MVKREEGEEEIGGNRVSLTNRESSGGNNKQKLPKTEAPEPYVPPPCRTDRPAKSCLEFNDEGEGSGDGRANGDGGSPDFRKVERRVVCEDEKATTDSSRKTENEVHEGSGENVWLKVGKKFDTVDKFREALEDYVMEEGFHLNKLKNERTRITCECVAHGCPWRIHASVTRDGVTFAIKTLNSEHMCVRIGKTGKAATFSWIARKLKDVLRENPEMKLAEMRDELQRKYDVDAPDNVLYRAKIKALETNEALSEEVTTSPGKVSSTKSQESIPSVHQQVEKSNRKRKRDDSYVGKNSATSHVSASQDHGIDQKNVDQNHPALALHKEVTKSPEMVSSTPSTASQESIPCNTSAVEVAEKQTNMVGKAFGVKITLSTNQQHRQITKCKRKREDINVDHNPGDTTHASASGDHDTEQTNGDQNLDVDLTKVLHAINHKYGDITRDCSLESDYLKTYLSLGICKVVQALQSRRLKDFDTSILDACYAAVRDSEKLNMNVHWLHKRLDEVRYAMRPMDEEKSERNMDMVIILEKKVELNRLESQIRDVKNQLARKIVKVDELNTSISAQESEFSRFEQYSSLMDGAI